MPVAQLVPLRRLPSHRSLFDYDIPEGWNVRPGQLVRAPFLRSQVLAVVWDVIEHSDVPNRKPISSIVFDEELITPWQRAIAKEIQSETFVSLGHILDGVIPKYTKNKTSPLIPLEIPKKTRPIDQWPEGKTWWYRDRFEAEDWLRRWLVSQKGPSVLVMPTIEDAERMMESVQTMNANVALLHSSLGQVEYRRVYESVRTGAVRRVVGTTAAALLPFSISPKIIIDQEEHPSYSAGQQHPRFDIRQAVEALGALSAVTTPSPSLWWWKRASPTQIPIGISERVIASLQEPTEDFWLTSPASDALDQATELKQQVLCIAPRKGFAGTIRCRTCGRGLDCPVCHHPSSLQGRLGEALRCQFCGQVSAMPDTCPQCHGVDWQLFGLGPDRLADVIGRRWSRSVIPVDGPVDTSTTAIIGTYQSYRKIHASDIHAIVVAHGDALLNIPDFSAEERAWQYLARLEASAPKAKIIVQTFRPELDFWQRWKNRDDATWYKTEMHVRERLQLPPSADQWIVRLPGKKISSPEFDRKVREVQSDYPNLACTVLPETKGNRSHAARLLLSSSNIPIRSLVSAENIFPTPWQVETSVHTWME